MVSIKIYKFKDAVDGRYAFVIAESEQIARIELETKTSIPFELVDYKNIEDYGKPIIIKNDILPF